MNDLLDRFFRYVQVESSSTDADQIPSSPGQLELGRILVDEMRALGLENVSIDDHGLVVGTVPGNVDGAPTIAWLAHLDTYPGVSGKNVRPIVHRPYDGRDIVLPGDPAQVIRVAETDGLAELAGKTLITSDGTTLLGADDKAGIAIVMTAAASLLRDPSAVPHGPIRVAFMVDEEVGRGTDAVEISAIDATCAYTLDGIGEGEIENETFSADKAIVTLTGVSTHPGLAKGKMVNAMRLAADFIDRLPRHLTPEATAERAGFIHPDGVQGDAAKVVLQFLLRSFVTEELDALAQILRDAARAVVEPHRDCTADVKVVRQYRNMLERLAKAPRVLELAEQAYRNVGVRPRITSLRGGTDGARLTEMGLPTPNLSAGMHCFHSEREFACLEEMETAVRMLLELARLWGAQRI